MSRAEEKEPRRKYLMAASFDAGLSTLMPTRI
jgi:hypothetical protein